MLARAFVGSLYPVRAKSRNVEGARASAQLAEEDAEAAARASAAGEQIAAIEDALDALDDDRAAGTFDTPAGVERYRDRYRLLLDAQERAQAEVSARAVLARSVGIEEVAWAIEHWDGLPLSERRRLIALTVDHVDCAPTSRGGRAADQLARAWARLDIVWTPLAAEALREGDEDVLVGDG
jgi:uncharacterized membrane protein YccC